MRSSTAVMVAGVLFCLLTGCGASEEVRFEISAKVISQGQASTGHAVWSVRLVRPFIRTPDPYLGKFRGDAIAVPLPTGGFLLVLPTGLGNTPDTASLIPEDVFREVKTGNDRLAHLRKISASLNGEARLRCPLYTMSNSSPGRNDVCLTLAYAASGSGPEAISIINSPSDLRELGLQNVQLDIRITSNEVSRTLEQSLPWVRRYDFDRLTYQQVKYLREKAGKEIQFIRR